MTYYYSNIVLNGIAKVILEIFFCFLRSNDSYWTSLLFRKFLVLVVLMNGVTVEVACVPP